MNTIFDKTTRDELVKRINSLNEDCTAQWGKMNVKQMVKHCTMWEEVVLGKRKIKVPLLGRLLGKFFLRQMIKDENPLKRSLPAVEELKVTESINGELNEEKREWISLINEYPQLSNRNYQLPFIGKVKKEQAGYVAFKHTDHHLRQFNV